MARGSRRPGAAIQRDAAIRRRRSGFTIVELMVVIGTMGILATTALPGLLTFAYKSRRAEAFVTLDAIYTAQAIHFNENGFYANTFDELLISLTGGQPADGQTFHGMNYTYSIYSYGGGQNFVATAMGNIDPRDPAPDVVVIGNNVEVN